MEEMKYDWDNEAQEEKNERERKVRRLVPSLVVPGSQTNTTDNNNNANNYNYNVMSVKVIIFILFLLSLFLSSFISLILKL